MRHHTENNEHHHMHHHGHWAGMRTHQGHDMRERWRGHGPGPGGPGAQDWRGFFEGGPRGPFGPFGPFGGPFGGRRGGPGGPGGRERLERGMLRYVILDLLKDGPKHGYEIIKQLEERTQGQYSPSPGTLYPTLQYLDDLGLVQSVQQDGRKVYELTDAGRAELAGHGDMVDGFWSHFRDRMPSGAGMHEVAFLKDAIGDLTRTVSGGIRTAVFTGNAEMIKGIRVALEHCQNEVRSIIAQAGAGAQSQEPNQPAQPQEQEPEEPSTGESQGQGTVQL